MDDTLHLIYIVWFVAMDTVESKGEEDEEQNQRQGPLTREEKMMCAWLKYYKSVANKEKAQLARATHRANLLCLLAHGLLLDQAANDPLVQAKLPTFFTAIGGWMRP